MTERPLAWFGPPGAHAGEPTPPQLLTPPPLAIYVHWPWCARKCPYCDFNSHVGSAAIPEADYVNALIADLEQALPQIWGRRVVSVFLGGGTPSLMSVAAVERLLDALRQRVRLDPQAEVTLEANPGSADAARFAGYAAAGVNRLSLGIQSFDDRKLAAIGRIHDGSDARRALDAALSAFARVNADLIYALPDQNIDAACADVAMAVAAGVTHLSAYHLTLEPNTPFAHQPPAGLPEDDDAAQMQDDIEALLAHEGFRHYETSAFARPGQECRHNLNYWSFGDYLGLGAGAHGKLSSADAIHREIRHRHPDRYLAAVNTGNFMASRREVSIEDRPFEFLMNALRLCDGVPAALFQARTGLPLAIIHDARLRAEADGLLSADPTRLVATSLGQRFLNDLLTRFLPDGTMPSA